ncbi:MAG: Holliday junction resolvase RuvX, partial [Actinobacteria bacterium]|nr:Holliday junction resolvase RuvX [Actinomycetota bacterium]
ARVRAIVHEQEAERVVVGLPLTLRGEQGSQALATEEFVRALQDALEVPVESYDERFTTTLAAGAPGTAPEDARAAAHLLDSYLTRMRAR